MILLRAVGLAVFIANFFFVYSEVFDRELRIIGGIETTMIFPFMATIGKRNAKNKVHVFCGAAIINEEWIITAAHCVVKGRNKTIPISSNRNNIIVSKGSSSAVLQSINDNIDSQEQKNEPPYYIRDTNEIVISFGNNEKKNMKEVGVQTIYVPAFYDDERFYGDIAILQLNSKIEFNENVNAIKISGSDIPPDLDVNAIGFGTTEQNEYKPSNKLRVATLKTGTVSQCQPHRSAFESNNEDVICCPSELNRDTCFGDSGGPLLGSTKPFNDTITKSINRSSKTNDSVETRYLRSEGSWVLLGITSYGDSLYGGFTCADSDSAGFFTNAAYYLPIILNITQIPQEKLVSNEKVYSFKLQQDASSAKKGFSEVLIFVQIIIIIILFS
ncbi:hypothetical protein BB560_006219 [Smittium megazygosporum]|uniref:Peptidase S1 domain-containing protein n=1 Tax=Smittium megazygosporum TaxID=133381 RepID=A0A2T9YD78_9FUNG|nr:hypothetical protein BB560_006219 [Smittium megazygosporum]